MTTHILFTGWVILKKKARHTQKEIFAAFDSGNFCRTNPKGEGWYIGKDEKAYKCTMKMVDIKKKKNAKPKRKKLRK